MAMGTPHHIPSPAWGGVQHDRSHGVVIPHTWTTEFADTPSWHTPPYPSCIKMSTHGRSTLATTRPRGLERMDVTIHMVADFLLHLQQEKEFQHGNIEEYKWAQASVLQHDGLNGDFHPVLMKSFQLEDIKTPHTFPRDSSIFNIHFLPDWDKSYSERVNSFGPLVASQVIVSQLPVTIS